MVATLKQYISNEVQNIIDTKLDNVDYIPNVYMTIIETLREISTVKESDEVLNKILEERLSSFIPKVSKKKNDGKDKFLSSLIAEAKLKGQDTTGYKYYFPPKMQAAMDALIAEKITLTNHTITANTTLPDMNEPLNDIQVHDMNEPTDIIVEETHIVQADPNDNFFLNDL